MTTTPQPRRFEVGEDYRLSQLRPGVIVVRQVSHGTATVSSGSPCCLRTATVDYWSITANQRHYATYGVGGLRHSKKCSGCGWKYDIHIPADTEPRSLRTIEWEVCP